MSKLIDVALKGAHKGFADEIREFRATRVPSKLKRELRRKYAKKHPTNTD